MVIVIQVIVDEEIDKSTYQEMQQFVKVFVDRL